jgi:hypothetical protein
LNRERANARAELATEIASEEFHQSLDGEWESTSTAPIAERNHPNPQGYWWVKVEGIKPDSLIRLLWPNYPQPKWEPCDDEDSPESVLLQKHEPPKGIVESSVPLRTPTTERGLYDAIRRYRLAWKAAGCPAYWQARAAPHTTRAESTPEKCPGAWALRHVEAPADALSAKRKECRRRCDAAIDGLLSNFGCDDLDRLTTSAAIEAA